MAQQGIPFPEPVAPPSPSPQPSLEGWKVRPGALFGVALTAFAAGFGSVRRFNAENADRIAAQEIEARVASSERFIVKASGIARRYVLDKPGVLDPERMRPRFPRRGEDEQSIQCEISVAAIRDARRRSSAAACPYLG